MAARKVRTGLGVRIGLIAGSVLFALLMLELGCRVARGGDALWVWKNYVLAERISMASQNTGSRFSADPVLGYVQRAGFTSHGITYDADGFRVMPPIPADASVGPPIVATGDSFTQGDEAADNEAWPAVLQDLLKRRTINAGVAAYGIDQTVLRTEQLAKKLKPALLVVGFIADDLRRAEMSRTWGAPKPYFELVNGELALRNVPVPAPPDPRTTLDFWQRAFGWSIALDTFLTMKGWRYEWVVDHLRATPPGTGEKLACPLMKRLASLGIPTVVVAQYDFYVWVDREFGAEQHRQAETVLACARQAGLATVDTYDATEKAVKSRGLRTVYGAWHPSAMGYRLIAELIAAEVEKRRMLPK